MSHLASPVVVTGATGFVGSHLLDRLKESWGDIEVRGLGTTDGDLTNLVGTSKLFEGAKTVIHLAARVGGIGANRKEPYKFWHDNLAMGLNVIESCIWKKVETLVVVGTVCSYPLSPPVPFKESDFWNGYPEQTNAPYGIAKRAIQEGLRAAHAEYGMYYAFPIPTNLYGPRDVFNLASSHVIPALIRKFVEAKAEDAKYVVLWGTGQPSRDFLHVRDAADGIIACAAVVGFEKPCLPALNLGTGQEIKICDLAEMIRDEVGYHGKILYDHSKPDGQPRRCVDNRLALKEIGWAPNVGLREGIRETIEWFRSAQRAAATS